MALESARTLPALQLNKVSLKADLRNNNSPPLSLTVAQAGALVASVVDEAAIRAGLSNDDLASLCGVSKSLVSRWRSPHYKERPSLAQLFLLPLTFQHALHKVLGFRFGVRRAAMAALLDAVADLATCEDEEQVG
jgi:transcriptional regulator with XRE-family HTH domain